MRVSRLNEEEPTADHRALLAALRTVDEPLLAIGDADQLRPLLAAGQHVDARDLDDLRCILVWTARMRLGELYALPGRLPREHSRIAERHVAMRLVDWRYGTMHGVACVEARLELSGATPDEHGATVAFAILGEVGAGGGLDPLLRIAAVESGTGRRRTAHHR